MRRTFLLPLAALLLALPGLRAANAISTPPEEQLTYHTDARFGRVLFIRNEAAQLTASDAFWALRCRPRPADRSSTPPISPSPNGPEPSPPPAISSAGTRANSSTTHLAADVSPRHLLPRKISAD
jgi:hypothetical protein